MKEDETVVTWEPESISVEAGTPLMTTVSRFVGPITGISSGSILFCWILLLGKLLFDRLLFGKLLFKLILPTLPFFNFGAGRISLNDSLGVGRHFGSRLCPN